MKKILFPLICACLALSLAANIVSAMGIDMLSVFPFILLLHLGIFVSVLSIMLTFKNLKERPSGVFGIWGLIFKNVPIGLTILLIALSLYGLGTFLTFIGQEGTPELKDGQYILQSRGKFIRNITVKEYHAYQANELRAFSGHWIFFYSIAFAALYGRKDEA